MAQVKIAILGCEYTIETKEEEQRTREVASLLDKWCMEVRKQRPGAPSQMVLTLAALHLANQYLYLKEDYEKLTTADGKTSSGFRSGNECVEDLSIGAPAVCVIDRAFLSQQKKKGDSLLDWCANQYFDLPKGVTEYPPC